MVKLVFLCRRRTDITHARYTTLLLEGHVPLALAHHPTMRRYVVNIVEEAPGAPPLDSIGELCFDTLTDYRERLYDSPEGERLIARDVARFLGGADAYATREHVVRPPPPAPTKKWILAVRHPAPRAPWHETDIPLDAGLVESIVEQRLSSNAPEYDAFVSVILGSGTSEEAIRRIVERRLGHAARLDVYPVKAHAYR